MSFTSQDTFGGPVGQSTPGSLYHALWWFLGPSVVYESPLQYCQIVVPPSFVDVDGASLRGSAFYWKGPTDGIYLPVLDESAASRPVHGLGQSLYSDLQGQSGVEDEFSEISFIDHPEGVAGGCNIPL